MAEANPNKVRFVCSVLYETDDLTKIAKGSKTIQDFPFRPTNGMRFSFGDENDYFSTGETKTFFHVDLNEFFVKWHIITSSVETFEVIEKRMASLGFIVETEDHS